MAVSSLLCLLFFCFFFFIISVDGQCLDHQKNLLLDLKSELIFNSSYSDDLAKWNQTDDCCEWDGVGCDGAGRVIRLVLYLKGISGRIGESSTLFRLTYLSELNLSGNDLHTSQILSWIHRLTNLRLLALSNAGLMGPIPSTLANLRELVKLDLSCNFLTSSIPSFHMCKNLEEIDLRDNNLKGSLSHLHFQGLTKLCLLDLSQNSFSGSLSHLHFEVLTNLSYLDLSSNRIEGPIPNSFFHLPKLTLLQLSNNLFNGTFQLQKIQSLPRLYELGLSYNNLSVVETTNMSSISCGFPQLSTLHLSSCNLYEFPNLRNQSNLFSLDLSNNFIGGDIPSGIWENGIRSLNLSVNFLRNLEKPHNMTAPLKLLDLHSNQLHCEFPLLLQAIHFDRPERWENGSFMTYLLLADNSLTGVIPTSICDVSMLAVLDLSYNNLSGSIPPCLVKDSSVLEVLNLRGNNISGAIPNQFSTMCSLSTFDTFMPQKLQRKIL